MYDKYVIHIYPEYISARDTTGGSYKTVAIRKALPPEIYTACEAWSKNQVDLPVIDYLNLMFNED
jgi:hypothetical protein